MMMRTININLPYDDDIIATVKIAGQIYQKSIDVGYSEKIGNKFALNQRLYNELKSDFPNCPAVIIQQTIFTAHDTLKTIKKLKVKTKPKCKKPSVRFTYQNFKFYPNTSEIGFPTINGRKKLKITIPDWVKRKYNIDCIKTASISMNRNKMPVAHIQIDVPTPNKQPINKVLGVDRGVKNIAVCSNNVFFNSKHLRNVKGKYQYLKSVLQSIGTRSAKKKLKTLAGRERRFVRNTNHKISKEIVNMPYDTIVLEDLKSIKKMAGRKAKKLCKTARKMIGNWSRYELQKFIEYKAEALGKNVIYINPEFTSQTCSHCGFTAKENRHGSVFHCVKCGFELHADLNASRNIADRGKLQSVGCIQPPKSSNGQPLGTNPQIHSVSS